MNDQPMETSFIKTALKGLIPTLVVQLLVGAFAVVATLTYARYQLDTLITRVQAVESNQGTFATREEIKRIEDSVNKRSDDIISRINSLNATVNRLIK